VHFYGRTMMMQGSVRKLTGAKGVTWSGVIELPHDPVTGRRRQKRVSGRTRREVEDKLRLLAGKLDQPEHIEAEQLTFAQFAEQLLEAAAPTLRPASVRRYTDMVRNHICPRIGQIRLQRLSPFDLQRLYADRFAYGLSATSVHHLHVMVYRVLKQAYRWGMVSRNVAELVDAPRRTFPEVTTWSLEQVATFFAVSDESDLAALWRLALLTGMRRGELLGLMWEDIDLERETGGAAHALPRQGGRLGARATEDAERPARDRPAGELRHRAEEAPGEAEQPAVAAGRAVAGQWLRLHRAAGAGAARQCAGDAVQAPDQPGQPARPALP
jgi:hypothetical protein